jgi:hypothetical protein
MSVSDVGFHSILKMSGLRRIWDLFLVWEVREFLAIIIFVIFIICHSPDAHPDMIPPIHTLIRLRRMVPYVRSLQ